MQHHIYADSDKYPVAILVKSSAFNLSEMQRFYINNIVDVIPDDHLILVSIPYNENNKAPVKFIKEKLESLLSGLDSLGVETIYCCDSNYFKVLTKAKKAEPHLGYVLPCAIKDYEHINIILGTNHKTVVYDPRNQNKLDLSLDTLKSHFQGKKMNLGADIIQDVYYPETAREISQALEQLHQYPMLTADIEAASLRFWEAGVGTITFCWDQHSGIAFKCDYEPLRESENGTYGELFSNLELRMLIKKFLSEYQGTLIWHNASYDIKVLIYNLWMDNPYDMEGMLEGLETLCTRFHDTKIIAYLAINSTAGNDLGLKTLAHEFAGNWAEEVKDITKIPLDRLLKYNLIDGLSTWYVFNKYYQQMIDDNQLDIYENLMLPSLKTIIQTELCGMPLSQQEVSNLKKQLEDERDTHLDIFKQSSAVRSVVKDIQIDAMNAANAKLKVKQHPLSKFSDIQFNPNSGNHVSKLLYEKLGLPILDRTATKLPATGGDTLKKLINHTDDEEAKAILDALIHHSEIDKILSSFIPAFEKSFNRNDTDTSWLHGSFNLGGTVSGRLSSSDPNLQNIPSNSTYGKPIKKCFKANDGWLFVGADFNSLEDYVSALQTKDPNKLRVYEEGYDGHCLRAFYYFNDEMSGIVETPDSINSIKDRYPKLRQDSKGPTFLLTYGGTFRGMMHNLGWPEDKAKQIERNYHDLYKVSDDWVESRLREASYDGYVECAFGLRVRTPILSKTIHKHKMNPYEAKSEARTAGNALGQSYGLLTNRALNDFMAQVWASEYRYLIKPVAMIHDAIYLVIKDNIHVVKWVNDRLIKAMQWQELPDIKHDTVKLGAELSIFWPSWADECVLPNNASKEQIREICDKHKSTQK